MPLFNSAFFTGLFLSIAPTLAQITMESLGFPSVDELVDSLKTEMLTSLEIVATNLIPAVGIALIIRKFTS